MRDLRVVLSQCAHVVVTDEEDSFKFDPEELDIAGDDDGDSDETDDDYYQRVGQEV